MSIKINYIENLRYLTEEQWIDTIKYNINKIKNTEVGKLLIDNINHYAIYGNTINIINYSRNNIFQYPNMSFNQNGGSHQINICIPDTPYFTKVPIMSPHLVELSEVDINIRNIYSCDEIDNKIDDEFVKSFSIYQFQPIVVMLFHELVHALRLLKGIRNSDREEESTMYGINGNSLYLEGKLITENTFRKELGLLPRISHDSEYLHVYGTSNTMNDKPKEFWVNAFRQIDIGI